MQKNHNSQFIPSKNVKSFGFLPNRKDVFCYTLKNKNGMELSVINYGATLTHVKVPVSADRKIDVVLGFDNLESYVDSFQLPSPPYLGTVVGRYAGRIKEGRFNLNGTPFQLSQNHGKNHLHGGPNGLSTRFWDVKQLTQNSLVLTCKCTPEEDGYPGILEVEATYTLTENNELVVQFEAHSTEDTILNLTQHSYFNLDGHEHSVKEQWVQLNSSKILETDSQQIPTGQFLDVRSSAFNFTQPQKCPSSIDTTFVVDTNSEPAATLFSETTKLKLTVFTNQPAVHVYVGGNCFKQIKGKEQVDYHTQSGICFETQNFPDGPNHPHFPSAVLKKGELYKNQTRFAFQLIP